MSKKSAITITPLQEFQIIEQWRFSKQNSSTVLAAEFKVSPQQIDKVINKYLLKKTLA